MTEKESAEYIFKSNGYCPNNQMGAIPQAILQCHDCFNYKGSGKNNFKHCGYNQINEVKLLKRAKKYLSKL